MSHRTKQRLVRNFSCSKSNPSIKFSCEVKTACVMPITDTQSFHAWGPCAPSFPNVQGSLVWAVPHAQDLHSIWAQQSSLIKSVRVEHNCIIFTFRPQSGCSFGNRYENLLFGGVKKKIQTLKYEKRNLDIYLEFTLFHFNKPSSSSLGSGAGISEITRLLIQKSDFGNVEDGTPFCDKACSWTFSLLPPHKCPQREAWINSQQIKSLRSWWNQILGKTLGNF